MILLRSVAFNLIFYLVLITMMVIGSPLLLAGADVVRGYAQRWARVSLWLFAAICRVRVDIRGIGNLPPGGVIVAAKHQSFLDILVLLTIAPRFVFVLKRELMLIPVFGQFLKRAGMIPIDRARGKAALADLSDRVRDALGQGQQLVIFPEGTRRPPGAEPRYKSGVSHLYRGERQALRAGGVEFRPVLAAPKLSSPAGAVDHRGLASTPAGRRPGGVPRHSEGPDRGSIRPAAAGGRSLSARDIGGCPVGIVGPVRISPPSRPFLAGR